MLDANGKPIEASKKKSVTMKKTLNPKWDSESFGFEVDSKISGILVEVWDWDAVGSDEFMGQFM